MSQMQKPSLAAALFEAGGSTRRQPAPLRVSSGSTVKRRQQKPASEPSREGEGSAPYQQPSRAQTVPVTGHFPKPVRDQLKILAIEQDSTLHNLMAEAYNDLFAKYGKPEIAPHQSMVVEK